MYVDVDQRPAELVEAESPDAIDGRVAQQAFPDLRAWKDAIGRVRWCSIAATEKVDRYGISRDDDGRIWVQPYLLQSGAVVFSDPPEIVIGRDMDGGFGVTPEPSWEEILMALRLPEPVIRGVKAYLNQHPPISWDTPVVANPVASE